MIGAALAGRQKPPGIIFRLIGHALAKEVRGPGLQWGGGVSGLYTLIQMPDRSGFPSRVRGVGPVGTAARSRNSFNRRMDRLPMRPGLLPSPDGCPGGATRPVGRLRWLGRRSRIGSRAWRSRDRRFLGAGLRRYSPLGELVARRSCTGGRRFLCLNYGVLYDASVGVGDGACDAWLRIGARAPRMQDVRIPGTLNELSATACDCIMRAAAVTSRF